MKLKFILPALGLGLLLVSCGGAEEETENQESDVETVDPAQFRKDLVELEQKLESNLESPKEEDVKKAITMFQDFAGIFPDDPEAPDYLLKASDMALSVGQVEKSVKILNRIVEEYPDYSRMEDVMFNKASHLDFELRDTTQAKVAYQEFIDRYPDSELRDDAESRIENIQYSLEELAEKFILEMEAGENQDLP